VSAVDVEQLLLRHARTVDAQLQRVLTWPDNPPPRLMEAINYSLTAGGKRLRPALVLESYRACSGHDASEPDSPPLLAAAAIELVHTFSLVHDDLPAMDDDDLRRGKPTNHKVFGEAMAILAGDAMMTLAFQTLTGCGDAKMAAALVFELAGFAGPEGMIGGQVLDIQGENRTLTLEQLADMHRRKTGALITCAARMGGIVAGADQSQMSALRAYGQGLGMAFQIVDDLLDVTSTPQQLGKATSKDARIGKNTYPRLMGIQASRSAAAEAVTSARCALDEFGHSADGLHALAAFVEQRSH
jgi:geranylgeranyl diphosphate synthase type II